LLGIMGKGRPGGEKNHQKQLGFTGKFRGGTENPWGAREVKLKSKITVK